MRHPTQTTLRHSALKDKRELPTMRRRKVIGWGSLALLTLGNGNLSLAQETYPARTIRLVVPLPAGSPLDVVGRRFAQQLSTNLGVPVIIDNKPGAALTIGAAEVARASPDGYTLLMTVAEPLVSAVAVMKIPYDPQRDFKLISKIAVSTAGPILIASNATSANDLSELVRDAKAFSTPITYASFGPGSFPQQIMESLAKQTGTKFTEVPYKGSPPALQDVLAGQVNLAFSSVETVAPLFTSGKIKAIAVVDKHPLYPRIQTFVEAGFTDFVFRNKPWIGLAAPSRTPDAVVQKLAAAAKSISIDSNFRKFLEEFGFSPIGNSPAEFADEYRKEMAVVPPLIKSLGVNPE